MKNVNTLFRIWSRIGSLSILIACILTVVGNITSAYAATSSNPASTYVHKQITKQQLPTDLCNQLKAHLPLKALKPDACTTIHTELSTDFTPIKQSRSMSIRPYGCFAGTKSFRDTYWTASFSVSLNTNWAWDGSCNIPAITYEDCHINWTAIVTITQTGCGSYTTSVPSRAALWTGWDQAGPFGSRVWARRECYVNVNCNWATY